MDLSYLQDYVVELINRMPKTPNRVGINRLLASHLEIIDVVTASMNILSVISGLITIGDFTYRLWQSRRRSAINTIMGAISQVNGQCSEEDAEALIAAVFRVLDKEYPPKIKEENETNN